MERLKIIGKLMDAKRVSTQKHQEHLAVPREYYPGELLYMREAHFVLAVDEGGPPTMSELSGRLEVTIGAASQLTLQMEKKGFVLREKCAADKRVILVKLTDKGKELCRYHRQRDREYYRKISELFDGFTDEQLEMLIQYEKLFSKIFDGIEAPSY